jgi:hypothetical protein
MKWLQGIFNNFIIGMKISGQLLLPSVILYFILIFSYMYFVDNISNILNHLGTFIPVFFFFILHYINLIVIHAFQKKTVTHLLNIFILVIIANTTDDLILATFNQKPYKPILYLAQISAAIFCMIPYRHKKLYP